MIKPRIKLKPRGSLSLQDLGANVVAFPGPLAGVVLPPRQVIAAAHEQCDRVTVTGYDEDGAIYIASTHDDPAECLMQLDLARRYLLSLVELEAVP